MSDDNRSRSQLAQLVSKLSHLKSLAMIGAGILAAGFAASNYVGELATGEDLQQHLRPVSEAIVDHEKTVNDHETRIKVIEKTYEDMNRREDIQSQQLYEIAIRVGAKPVDGIKADAGVTQ